MNAPRKFQFKRPEAKAKQPCRYCGGLFVNPELHITKTHAVFKVEMSFEPDGTPAGGVVYKNGKELVKLGGSCAGGPDYSWGCSPDGSLYWKYQPSTKRITFHHEAGGLKAQMEPHPGKIAFNRFTLVKV